MCQLTVLDTFTAFETFWKAARRQPLEVQLERWADEYMAQWPELLAKQQQDYAEQGVDWRAVAMERIFPYLSGRMPSMRKARRGLLSRAEPVCQKARQAVGLDFDVTFVIYVGIGCGAGWATTYQGRPACLCGLENIAECGWTEPDTLAALVAHELSHLLHHQWRARNGLPLGKGPFWQLYEEGFAQKCEHRIMGEETWHEADTQDQWLAWCTANRAGLAREFLRAAEQGEAVNRFFGSWYEILGHSQCGYFLGREVVEALAQTMTLREIALLKLDEMEQCVRKTLRQLAG